MPFARHGQAAVGRLLDGARGQRDIQHAAKGLGLNTIKRAELAEDKTSLTVANDLAVRRALEAAGVEFIDEKGGGPGVRLRKRPRSKNT
jgi:hypothetical protein